MNAPAHEFIPIEIITPNLAAIFLATSTGNVRFQSPGKMVSTHRVSYFADCMREGKFYLTEPIRFDANGVLFDGHHRLHAVIQCGISQKMMVHRDCPREAPVDDGRFPRGFAAHLRLNHPELHWVNHKHVALAEVMHCGLDLTWPTKFSRSERADFFLKHNEPIRSAYSLFTKKSPGINVAPVHGAFARAYYHIPQILLVDFSSFLQDGMPRDGNWRPEYGTVAKLIRALHKSAKLSKSATGRREQYALTVRALEAFADGHKLQHLHPAKVDPFPLTGVLGELQLV